MSASLAGHRSDLIRFCCALCAADGPSARRLFESRGDLDWMAFVELAREYRLAMLLYRAVNIHLAELVSPAAVAALRKLYAENLSRCLAMTAELRHVLDRLASEQISVIPFKGPVFAAQLYGDVALRVYGDLDILIQERDAARATRAMLDAGYRLRMNLSWETSFERGTGTTVDVHWSIAEKVHQFPLSAEELWSSRASVNLAGSSVPTLGAEGTLLALCFNGVTEDWQRFDRIADVAEFMRGSAEVDWGKFMELCRRHGCERLVLIALHLARELFQVKLPECVELRLHADRKAIAAAGFEIDDFMHFAITSTDRRHGFDSWRFLLRIRERQRERIPYYQSIAYSMLTPKDGDAPWLRKSRQLLYAVLRLPLLGVKRGLRVIGYAPLREPGNRP